MSFPADLYSNEEATEDVGFQEGDGRSSPISAFSQRSILDEEHLETVLQDFAIDYVMLASNSIPDRSHSPPGYKDTSPVDTPADIEDDFVLISKDDISWWDNLEHYIYSAFRKGGEWTSLLTEKAVDRFQPRKSGIHSTYDWVSDTNVAGGRLILPGQLISWDDSADTSLEDTRSLSHSSTMKAQTNSVIMVSAYDLLACRTNDDEDCDLSSGRTTQTIPAALARIAKDKTVRIAKRVKDHVRVTAVVMKDRAVDNLVSLPLAGVIGAIQTSVEWCFRTSYFDEPRDPDTAALLQNGNSNEQIELSTIIGIKDRLAVKEHTLLR